MSKIVKTKSPSSAQVAQSRMLANKDRFPYPTLKMSKETNNIKVAALFQIHSCMSIDITTTATTLTDTSCSVLPVRNSAAEGVDHRFSYLPKLDEEDLVLPLYP